MLGSLWRQLTSGLHRRSPAADATAPISNYTPGADGKLSPDDLIDQASEDSFPASDPPAHMGSLIPGRPGRPH